MKLFIKKTMVLIGFTVFVFSPSCFAESAGTVFLQNNIYYHSSDAVKLAKPADGMTEVPVEELKHHKSPEDKRYNGEDEKVDSEKDSIQ
ncbi:MAG: hypothetical protein IJG43_10615 [Acidaminococcaceae bacterium]|nr:hypothetical protein [Acidaminococcaceae bacterium]